MKWLGETQGSVKFSGKSLPWLSSEVFQCARIRIFFPFHPHDISSFYGQLAGTFPVGISSWVPLLVGFLSTFLTTEPSQCRSLNQPFAASEWCKELVYDGFGLSISLPLKKKKKEGQVFATDKMAYGSSPNSSCKRQASTGLGRDVPMQSFQCDIFCVLSSVPTRLAWLTSAVPSLKAHREQ